MRTNLSIVIILIVLILGSCQKTGSEDSITDQTPSRPVLTTSLVSLITDATATCGGNISSDGGATIIAKGICWNTSSFPTTANNMTTDGNGSGNFSSSITGLEQDSKYYVRAYATNSIGTTYGNEQSFITKKGAQTVTDIDGNIYHTVTIGTQVWMVENLKTTRYRNGDPIPNITLNASWAALTTGGWCNYLNDVTIGAKYGKLYNWFAAVDSRNIAPLGWHVASNAEWTELTTFLGGEILAGGKLKEASDNNWSSPNTGATNESGFSALPGGDRNFDYGSFRNIGNFGYWWCSDTSFSGYPRCGWSRYICWKYGNIYRSGPTYQNGMSVRCVKD